ncbi:capsule biosynthesis protein CapD [Pleurocapsa sp. CCALA 161]|uniref:polysaccharide biosynthesis protein n=1 Tax=Pleurocapsa sp. CCALA 161 TaxID=2107688 RepID=UPI000D08295A|nr:polysaccharide biosynthesis protein [Pleurocapsa sp. CCALA 161]PSB09473.1 capsule biosynthesis protein CapD [Pleurocapsa sp. CCALA 161]
MRLKKLSWERITIGKNKKLLNLNNRHFFILDGFVFCLTPVLAMILRLDHIEALQEYYKGLFIATIIFSIVKLFTFIIGGFYKRYWKYASIDELIEIAALTTTAVVIEIILLSILQYIIGTETEHYLVPRSLPLLDGILSFILIGGVRFSVRATERKNQQRKNFYKRDRVLIVGAGDAGVSIMQEMRRNLKLGLNPVAFVDDDPKKLGLNIQGLPVVGNRYRIPEIISAHNIRQVVIAMPTTAGKTIREIVDVCQAIGVPVNTLPSANEILDQGNRIPTLREVKIEDLLRREPIQTDAQGVAQLLTGKVVLITGAGGSIGSELCRQIFRCRPAKMILLGHGENSVFNIQEELQQVLHILQQEDSDRQLTQLVPYIADLRIKPRLEDAFSVYQPDVVFHAAAHKHVPLMELNPPEAITNNVLGTKNLLDLAISYDVGNFVMISTDKAVKPTNVMGASKRTAEMLVLKAARTSGKPYTVVRFGNVLGSRGSVVPTFKQQIAKGGPVTITHPDITRYFMTIPEAVQLVLQAAVLSSQNSQGQIFMLNMGQPIKIVDLARDLISLSGYEVGKDIDIVFTGLRPGEKLYEELLVEGEEYESTAHEKILVVKNASRIIPPNLNTTINILCQAAKRNDINLIIFLLDRLVVGYTSKYQQINIEQAQDSLEQIISQTHELNSVTLSLQPEFIPRSSLPSFNYVTRLTPIELRRGIKQALENEEFSLYYQPVMSLTTGVIREFEALLRWHHPHLGLISPQKFMPVAEESGLIIPLQRWIIEAVCSQLKRWQQDPNFDNKIGVSINVPSLQLLQTSLVKYLRLNLDKYQISPHLITWEISEYLIAENPQPAIAILSQLKQLGIRLQLDNFGRVASIYGHVKPNSLYQEFKQVKIDRYLVGLIERDRQAWDMLRKIVLELKKQSFSVTITGIENLSQLNKVKEIAEDYGQGNLLSQPLSSAEATNLITSNHTVFNKSNLN